MTDTTRLEQRLSPILALLQKQQLLHSFTQRQDQPRADLIENLLQRQQEAELRRALAHLNGPDAAHLLQMLTTDKRTMVWHELPDSIAAQALIELPDGLRTTVRIVGSPVQIGDKVIPDPAIPNCWRRAPS